MHHKKKIILITGVNKGIGNGLATKLSALGHQVIGTVRQPQTVKGTSELYTLDLTNSKSIEDLSQQLIKADIQIDMLINNAGIGSDYYDTLSKEENFELRFQTHIFGLYFLTESLLHLINPSGKIINISSKLASFDAIETMDCRQLTLTKAAYIMSKTSLNMYTKILANQLKHTAIEVLSVHPGWVKTNLSQTNQNAPMNVTESVDGILKILEQPKPSGTFWDAEQQQQLQW